MAEKEIPPGATKKAMNRPLERGGGPPGSAAGPRHAADDEGTENEEFGRTDTTITPASPDMQEEDALEKGPPFAGPSGGAVGGSPAQKRSAERGPTSEEKPNPDPMIERQRLSPTSEAGMKRLTGFEAIEYAEKMGLTLHKHPDSVDGPRMEVSVAEATAIADEDASLIWLDVSEEDYFAGAPTDYDPER